MHKFVLFKLARGIKSAVSKIIIFNIIDDNIIDDNIQNKSEKLSSSRRCGTYFEKVHV